MAFGDRLALIRRERGLTQEALAMRVDLSVDQIRRYESGRNEPTLGVIKRLATALSVTSDAIVFESDERLGKDEELKLAFEATVLLDDHERDAVMTMLKGFLAGHEFSRGREGPRARRKR